MSVIDLGKKPKSEQTRLTDEFLPEVLSLARGDFVGKKKGAAKAPCGSHRSRLSTQAASALLSTIHEQLDWF